MLHISIGDIGVVGVVFVLLDVWLDDKKNGGLTIRLSSLKGGIAGCCRAGHQISLNCSRISFAPYRQSLVLRFTCSAPSG